MIDISQVKKLRDLTGAGMMDCQKALEETNSDIDGAVEVLRKKGGKVADKKSSRTVNEGVIAIAKKDHQIAVIALNCETDFVAKNEDFIRATDEFAQKLLETGKEKFKTWAELKIKDELIVKIGENLQLGKFDILKGKIINFYLHSNKKIASVVILSGGDDDLAKEIAMHVTAMNPQYLQIDDVPSDVVEKEREIYKEQLKSAEGFDPSTSSGQAGEKGKPEDIVEKILEGKLNKFYKEVCLLKQAYIKDDKISIEKLLSDHQASIEKFERYSL